MRRELEIQASAPSLVMGNVMVTEPKDVYLSRIAAIDAGHSTACTWALRRKTSRRAKGSHAACKMSSHIQARGGRRMPFKGGALVGNLLDALANVRWSTETGFYGDYQGPTTARFGELVVAGAEQFP